MGLLCPMHNYPHLARQISSHLHVALAWRRLNLLEEEIITRCTDGPITRAEATLLADAYDEVLAEIGRLRFGKHWAPSFYVLDELARTGVRMTVAQQKILDAGEPAIFWRMGTGQTSAVDAERPPC